MKGTMDHKTKKRIDEAGKALADWLATHPLLTGIIRSRLAIEQIPATDETVDALTKATLRYLANEV